MQIRPATNTDLDALKEIDGTVESTRYLHLEHSGEGFDLSWRLEERPLREKLIEPNRLADDAWFAAKQVIGGIDEGLVLVAEHGKEIVAALIAQPREDLGTLQVIDLRVDYEYRREGLGLAMMYQAIQAARESARRAVSAETITSNLPAAGLLAKCGFQLSGLDIRRRTNHDMVKESATLFWYAALD